MEKVPLTKQLVDQLEAFIKEKLQPNDKLPSERDLSELYHVQPQYGSVRVEMNYFCAGSFIAVPAKARLSLNGLTNERM